jgi:hypothetical protein
MSSIYQIIKYDIFIDNAIKNITFNQWISTDKCEPPTLSEMRNTGINMNQNFTEFYGPRDSFVMNDKATYMWLTGQVQQGPT